MTKPIKQKPTHDFRWNIIGYKTICTFVKEFVLFCTLIPIYHNIVLRTNQSYDLPRALRTV